MNDICIIASSTPPAQNAAKALSKRYGFPVVEAEAYGKITEGTVVALGGDGFMLHTLHQFIDRNVSVYGMNCGTVGFLMNAYQEQDLPERIVQGRQTLIHPLRMKATTVSGKIIERWAINEVSLIRASQQVAHISISVDQTLVLEELIGDGVMLATPAGSSAYNVSAGGPILPIRSEIVALTPISPFRPRRWRGALLPDRAIVKFKVLEPKYRPANAVADFNLVEQVSEVEIVKDHSREVSLIFDIGHSLEERILREQFLV